MRKVDIKPRHPVGASFKLYKTVCPKVSEGCQSIDDVIVGYQLLTPKYAQQHIIQTAANPQRITVRQSPSLVDKVCILVMINNQNKMQLCQHYPHKSINYCHKLLLISILSNLSSVLSPFLSSTPFTASTPKQMGTVRITQKDASIIRISDLTHIIWATSFASGGGVASYV